MKSSESASSLHAENLSHMTRQWRRPGECPRVRFLQIRRRCRSGEILLQFVAYRVSRRGMMSDEVVVVYIDKARCNVVLGLEGVTMQLS